MESILKLGYLFPALQAEIDRHFRCHEPEEVMADPALRDSIRAVITRSNYQVQQAMLEQLPALKVVATNGVGYDGIPVAWAQQRGIVVTHTPGVLDAAVCELAVGLLLSLLRDIPGADAFTRSGEWSKGPYRLGYSLKGKRVGIVGLGRIGHGIVDRLKPFGVEVSYADGPQPASGYRHFPDALSMAPHVDIMIVSCKGGAETHHLINAEVLAALGEGFLVNVSRGTVVDEAALVDALTNGKLRGAALDVYEKEPLENSRLVDIKNLVLTPHNGSATHETRALMLEVALENLHAVLEGRPATTPVPPQAQ